MAVLFSILGLCLGLGLAVFSVFAVSVVERETSRALLGKPLGPLGLEYFIGPIILLLILLGILKVREMFPTKEQKKTILELRIRAYSALNGDPDMEYVSRLYDEGLVYRNKWATDQELNEIIGVLNHVCSRHSGKVFVNQLKHAIAAQPKSERLEQDQK